MGINVTVRKYPKQKDVITAEAALERDIRSCMRCRFFHHSRRCIANECIKTAENRKLADGISQKNPKENLPYNRKSRIRFSPALL